MLKLLAPIKLFIKAVTCSYGLFDDGFYMDNCGKSQEDHGQHGEDGGRQGDVVASHGDHQVIARPEAIADELFLFVKATAGGQQATLKATHPACEGPQGA